MRTRREITEIANGIYAEITDGLGNLAEGRKSQVAGLIDKKVEDVNDSLSDIIAAVEAIVKAPRVNGVGLPNFFAKTTFDTDAVGVVDVSIRTKLKSDYKYSDTKEIKIGEDFIEVLGKFYTDALFAMFYIEMARANVADLNAKVAELIEAHEIPYSLEFAVDNSTDALVLYIDNDKLVFNASVEAAQELSSLPIFGSEDEYYQIISDEYIEKLVGELKAIPTTVQLVKGNLDLVKTVTDSRTKRRADKLIRCSYHRQAKYLNAVKSGIGYFNETVQIDGKDVDVFSLVNKAEDGTLSVILTPFNVENLYNVDFDVIAAVKEQLAS